MEFVNPFFLFGLFAISIPIVIHLFNFRKFRKVYFTNVKFIEELKQQTQKQSQLKHLIILLLRILAIISLVLAFAQPFIPVSDSEINNEERNAVSIYIDNSFSMESVIGDGSLLNEAKNKSKEIVSAYKNTDLFQLLTNDFEGRHQRFVSQDEFIELLQDIDISPVSRNISEILLRQDEILSGNNLKNKTAYLISDFQKNTCDLENIKTDSSIRVFFVPLESHSQNNLYIDSCWFDSPVHRINQLVSLNVRIRNASDTDFEKIPVKLLINGRQRAIAGFDINSGGETTIKLPFTNTETGIQYGILEITDYPVTFDDILYFSYDVSEQIPILTINENEKNIYLNSLFSDDTAFVFTNSSQKSLDYSSFGNYNLIILNEVKDISSGLAQEIKRFVDNGGSLAVLPSPEMNTRSYRDFLKSVNTDIYTETDTFRTRVGIINAQNRLFEDVFELIPENIDLPEVFKHYKISKTTNTLFEVLLEMQNGDAFFGSMPVGKGMIYLFAVPLNPEWSNFPRHAVFVPTFYKIALLSAPLTKLFYTAGEDENIEVRNGSLIGDQIFRITSAENDFEIIPEHRTINAQIFISTHNQLKKAGNYNLEYNGHKIAGLSFNYDRTESDLSCHSSGELKDQIKNNEISNLKIIKTADRSITEIITEINKGIRLWKFFVILALIFLLAEVIILRIWR